MNCVGCHKKIRKGEFVTLNGGAMVKTKTGAMMGDKNLLGFLTVNNHFDSKHNYRSMSLSHDAPNGQFEFYACSHKCLADFMVRDIMMLAKLEKIKKIEIAPSKKIEKLGKWVDQVLKIIGFPEALVTDESSLFDFFDMTSKEKDEDILLTKWGKKLGFKVKGTDKIWQVADRLVPFGQK
jgi:hypothetical protein